MRIALIGMAGAGKSYWSTKLQRAGFKRFCCDDMIAQRLAPDLIGNGPEVITVARWMGFPHEAGYKERESRYMQCEQEVMEEILTILSGDTGEEDSDIVIDTTGSVIYVDENLLRKLKRYAPFVLLLTPPRVRKILLEAYISKPHPMVWRNFFQQNAEESPWQAMARCYPKLFDSRKELYEKYADICLDFYEIRKPGFGIEEFIRKIKSLLSQNSLSLEGEGVTT